MIKTNLIEINNKISSVCKNWGRSEKDINIVAVSKRQPKYKIEEAIKAGHRLFGENKVQEAYEHWYEIKEKYDDIKLHLIGHLQSNKVKDAVALFDVIESLDSKKLAKKIAKECDKQDKKIKCFIQVNTGKEEQKTGVFPEDLEDLLNYSVNECGLDISGLMCIPPTLEPSGLHFAFLNNLAMLNGLNDLSMGMSMDYDKGVMAGANYVRIGTALFGDREYSYNNKP